MSTTTTTDPTAPTVTARLCIHCDEPVPAPTSASSMTRCGHCGTLMSPDRLYDDGERVDAFELHPYFDEAATYESDEDAADAYARAVGAPPDPDTGQPLAIWGVTRQEDDPDEPADMFVAVPIGAAAGIAGQTRQAPRESTIVPTIDARGVVELPSSSPLATVCGGCGRGWLDEHTSDATPAPSGRCPFEYDHPDEDSPIR